MPKGKLSPEGEVIAAYGAAMVAAFQVLINCLEENDALQPGQFPDALRVYMEMVKSRQGDVSDMTLPGSMPWPIAGSVAGHAGGSSKTLQDRERECRWEQRQCRPISPPHTCAKSR
jgi:hypothetical protein